MSNSDQTELAFGCFLFGSLVVALFGFIYAVNNLVNNPDNNVEIATWQTSSLADTLTANPKPDVMELAWKIKDIQLGEEGSSFKVNVKGLWYPIRFTKTHPNYKDYVEALHHYPDFLTFAKTQHPITQSLGDLVYPTSWSVAQTQDLTVVMNTHTHLHNTL